MNSKKVIAGFCNCSGLGHRPGCVLHKRLKIKYHPIIKQVWDKMGAKFTEELIDLIVEER